MECEDKPDYLVRKQFNNDLITGDEGRDVLPKTLITKLDKVQKCLARFKVMHENANDKFIDEVKQYNLTKFTSEVAESISKTEFPYTHADPNAKTYDFEYDSEIQIVVDICEVMHHRYDDFQKQLVKSLTKSFKATSEVTDIELRASKRQTLLFLMTELFMIGIILEYKRIFNSLREIFSECKTADPQLCSLDIILISKYLTKYQERILNMRSRKQKSDSSNEEKPIEAIFLTLEQSEALKGYLVSFYTDIALIFYNKQHGMYTELKQKYEEDMKKIDRGNQDDYYLQKEFFISLIPHMEALANLLDQDIPDYKEKKVVEKVKEEKKKVVVVPKKLPKYWPFDDPEEYKFYRKLPPCEGKKAPEEKVKPEYDFYDEEEEENQESPYDKFTKTIYNCINEKMIDEKTVEFLSKLNTKQYRKRLGKFIFYAPKSTSTINYKTVLKTNLSFLRLLCRMVAIISQKHNEVKNELIKLINKEHQELTEAQDVIKIQSKLKNIWFVGELTKFGLMEVEVPLTRFKECIEDMRGHNAELIYNICECCGRYLIKHERQNPSTQLSFNNMLDRMWERKIQGLFSDKTLMHVENAYFACRPVQTPSQAREENITESQKNIKQLIFDTLTETTADDVIKQIRRMKLDKNDEDFLYRTINKFALTGTYNDLDNICYILSHFTIPKLKDIKSKIIEELLISAVKEYPVDEDISSVSSQQRIQQINFIGTLHYYNLIKKDRILNLLHSFIDDKYMHKESPESNFRIRLVCTLLENLAFAKEKFERDFSRGYRRKFDKFLKFFQRFIYSIPKISMDVEFMALDILENIRPNMKIFADFDEADRVCKQLLEKEEQNKISGVNSDDDYKSDEDQSPKKDSKQAKKFTKNQQKKDQDDDQEMFDKELRDLMEESLTQGRQKRGIVKPNTGKLSGFMKLIEGSEKNEQDEPQTEDSKEDPKPMPKILTKGKGGKAKFKLIPIHEGSDFMGIFNPE